jgi:hypothetical protein
MIKYAAKLQRFIYLVTEMRKELGLKGIEWVEKRLLEIELTVGKRRVGVRTVAGMKGV